MLSVPDENFLITIICRTPSSDKSVQSLKMLGRSVKYRKTLHISVINPGLNVIFINKKSVSGL